MSSEIILKIENITKSFPGTLALDNVSLDVKRGEALALVGENGAGKSTLMNIISGVHKEDSGHLYFEGKKVDINSPKEAQELGIGFVHQELSLCNHVSVAENIFMSGETKGAFLDRKSCNKKAEELLSKFNVSFKASDIVENLNVAQQQIVEISKALSINAKLIIFDEPSASLTEFEIAELFKVIKELKKSGIAVLYISHRLAEIFEICERVTVLKDGKYVDTYNTTDVKTDNIVNAMVGRNIENLYPYKATDIGETIFEVKGLTAERGYRNCSFELKAGEILTFYGLIGSGRTELVRGICGIDKRVSGEIFLHDKQLSNKSYIEAIKNGIVYVSEDRKEEGLFLDMSIQQNVSVAVLKDVLQGLFINNNKERRLAKKYVNKLNAKVADVSYNVSSLSGGNQQKIMIGKWLAANPKLIIMDEPTRGIDVGAKFEIHRMIRGLAESGIGVIVITSDLPEAIGLSDRIIVMKEGAINGEVGIEDMTEENVIAWASHTD